MKIKKYIGFIMLAVLFLIYGFSFMVKNPSNKKSANKENVSTEDIFAENHVTSSSTQNGSDDDYSAETTEIANTEAGTTAVTTVSEAEASTTSTEIDDSKDEVKEINKKAKKAYAKYLSNIYNAAYNVTDEYVDVFWSYSDSSYNVKKDMFYNKNGKLDISCSPGYGDEHSGIRLLYYGLIDIDLDGIDELILGKYYLSAETGMTSIMKYNNEKNIIEKIDFCHIMTDFSDDSFLKFYKNGSFVFRLGTWRENHFGRYFIKKSLLDKYIKLKIEDSSYKDMVKAVGHINDMVEVDIYFDKESGEIDVSLWGEGTSGTFIGIISSSDYEKLNKDLEKIGLIKDGKLNKFSYDNLSKEKYVKINKKYSASWIPHMTDYLGEWTNGRGNITISSKSKAKCKIYIQWSGGAMSYNEWRLNGEIKDDGIVYYKGIYLNREYMPSGDYEEYENEVSGKFFMKYIDGVCNLLWDDPNEYEYWAWIKYEDYENYSGLFMPSYPK